MARSSCLQSGAAATPTSTLSRCSPDLCPPAVLQFLDDHVIVGDPATTGPGLEPGRLEDRLRVRPIGVEQIWAGPQPRNRARRPGSRAPGSRTGSPRRAGRSEDRCSFRLARESLRSVDGVRRVGPASTSPTTRRRSRAVEREAGRRTGRGSPMRLPGSGTRPPQAGARWTRRREVAVLRPSHSRSWPC